MTALSFHPPSYRASQSDLTISISPLGLVEMADEEFEVHGLRLSRYSLYWAHYLGHMYAYRREVGEPQFAANYVRALSDYIINFTFGKGVTFRTPPATSAIVPPLLKRVWEQDNNKDAVLWEMGQTATVTGDTFVKVAYEDPYVDTTGRVHPGRVRIIPLNPAHAFPIWHEHDRSRMLSFKLKYRFWGCCFTDTEALTVRGWKHHSELEVGDQILTLNPDTDAIEWKPVQAINVYDYDGHMVQWNNHIDAVTTPNHRWLAEKQDTGERLVARTEFGFDGDPAVDELPSGARIVVGGGAPLEFRDQAKYSDELVESVAWYVCDGSDHTNQAGFKSIHLSGKKEHKVAAWRRLAAYWTAEGATWREGKARTNGQSTFYLGKGVVDALQDVAPDKAITPEFLCSLTYNQARMFRETLIAADGHVRRNSVRWTQVDQGRRDSYQMLCAMLGIRSNLTSCGEKVQEHQSRYIGAEATARTAQRVYAEDGKIWCPTVEDGVWFARRNGSTFWTGNTAPDGTRMVHTYVERISETGIEEFINDELIDARPNPLGVIPVVYIPNNPVSGSPWGTPDIADIVPLNREFNEKAMEISDIINYHAAPITVVSGARASQLEKGPRKTWTLPKDATVTNLQALVELNGPLAFLDMVKRIMHEMTGVPEQALGQMQPISNTSGTALHVQYQPLMIRYNRKKLHFSQGMRKINELVLLTLFQKEPWTLEFDPTEAGRPTEGALTRLDPNDPNTYESSCHWPPPLPVDILVKLNEIMAKMNLGLESKRGALRELGEEFPEEKMAEIFAELLEDQKESGALQLREAATAAAVALLTGMPPDPGQGEDGEGTTVTSTGNAGGEGQGQAPLPGPEVENLAVDLVTMAYGGRLAQFRNPSNK